MWGFREQITATFWSVNAICIILVAVRIYVRITTVYRPWSELLVLWALIMQIVYCITQILTYYRFHLHDFLEGKPVAPHDIEWVWKILFINEFIIPTGVVAYQAVLMLMYMEICRRHVFPRIWVLIMITWVLIAAFLAVTIIYSFFTCAGDHFSTLWYGDGSCNNNPYLITKTGVEDIAELMVYVIPSLIVYQLPNLTRIQKIGIVAMFSIGFANVAFFAIPTIMFICRLIDWNNPNPNTWYYSSTAQSFEQFVQGLWIPTGLIVVCVPQLRVLGRWKLGRKVVGSVSRAVSGSVGVTASMNTTSVADPLEGAEPTAGERIVVNVNDEEKGITETPLRRASATSSSERVH